MTKELREKVADKIYHCKIQYRKSSDVADEIINLILDEVKEIINSNADYVPSENGGYVNYQEVMDSIEQLRGER